MSEIEKEIVDSAEVKESKNFIEQIIEKDLAEGVYDTVHTRFPPEPNGYLHIGHAKSILLNYVWLRNTTANLTCVLMIPTHQRKV